MTVYRHSSIALESSSGQMASHGAFSWAGVASRGICFLLGAALSATCCAGQLVPPSPDASKQPGVGSDMPAGWTAFLDLMEKAKRNVISDATLRAMYGPSVTKKPGSDQSYYDYYHHSGSGMDDYEVGLAYLARPIGAKNYLHPASTVTFALPLDSCVREEAANSEMTGWGLVLSKDHGPYRSIDHYFKEDYSHVKISFEVKLFLRTAVPARTGLEKALYGPRPAVKCVAKAVVMASS